MLEALEWRKAGQPGAEWGWGLLIKQCGSWNNNAGRTIFFSSRLDAGTVRVCRSQRRAQVRRPPAPSPAATARHGTDATSHSAHLLLLRAHAHEVVARRAHAVLLRLPLSPQVVRSRLVRTRVCGRQDRHVVARRAKRLGVPRRAEVSGCKGQRSEREG